MQTRQYQSPGTGARYQIHLGRLADGSYSIDADPECFMVIINFLQVGSSLRDMTQYADLLQIHPNTVAFFSMIG